MLLCEEEVLCATSVKNKKQSKLQTGYATQNVKQHPVSQKVHQEKEVLSKNTEEELDEMPQLPSYDRTTNYYEMYWQMYLRNEALMQQIN